MNNSEQIHDLLKQKAALQAKINVSTFDGSVEIKEIKGKKFIYIRKRVLGKNTSTYLGEYSEELYTTALNQSKYIRSIKKQLREVERQLAKLGYEEGELSARVKLNIDFARANIKNLIYDQAVLEGVSTTFPQTESILDNGEINGVQTSDVIKILNLKHAWEFIVDSDVISSSSDYYLLSYIARLVNENFFENGGKIRDIPVSIGGSSYQPPIPNELDVKEKINEIIDSNNKDIDKAIELALYCMKTQVFIDGNKRASIIFANHYMISHGQGLLVVPENDVHEFKKLLVDYYEDRNEETMKEFLKEKCWRKF